MTRSMSTSTISVHSERDISAAWECSANYGAEKLSAPPGIETTHELPVTSPIVSKLLGSKRKQRPDRMKNSRISLLSMKSPASEVLGVPTVMYLGLGMQT